MLHGKVYFHLCFTIILCCSFYADDMRSWRKKSTNVLIISELFLPLHSNDNNENDLRIVNKRILAKLIRKNRGNSKLEKAVLQLISDIEESNWQTPLELAEKRPDADCVYGGEFYFFNIRFHRTLILIEFEDNGEATIVWAGSHDDYELTFKNNKNVIKKWLKDNNWI